MISRAVLFEQVVGRDAELDRLLFLREQSALKCCVRLATICGESGIGKSRLIAEFGRRSASPRNVFLHVRAYAEGTAPYAPLADALESIARSNPRSEVARSGLQALRSADGNHVSPEEIVRRRLVRVAEAFVSEAKRCGQLTLIVDDAHWCDVETLTALRFLAQRSDAPLLIGAAYRSDDFADPLRLSALGALEREGADRIVLAPLREREQLQLLRATLPATPDSVLIRIVELAEGRPFFAEELARSAAEGRSASDVPLTLRAAILGRIADLSREARDVLNCAAALGPAFSFEDLAALSGSEPRAIIDALRDALKRQIVIEDDVGGRFRFRHALTHAVFLGETLAIERRDLHRAMADRIEASGNPDRIDELAYHRWASGDAAAAIVACEAAGDAAVRLAAFNDAARWFDRALGCSEDDGDFERLSRKRLDALIDAGALDALAAHCDRMCSRLEGTSFEKTAALASCRSAAAFAAAHRVREAVALLDSRVVTQCASLDADVRFERRLALASVGTRSRVGDRTLIEEIDAAQADARERGPHAEARLLHIRQAAALLAQMDAPEFSAVTERAAALASASGDYRLQGRIANNHAGFIYSVSVERAISLGREAVAFFESRGDYAAGSHASSNLASYLISAGNLAEGAALVRRAEASGLLSNVWLGAQLLLAEMIGGDMQRFVALLDPERFDGSPWIAFIIGGHGARALPPREARTLINQTLPYVAKKPAGLFAVSVALAGDDAALDAVRAAMRDYVPMSPLGLANFKLFSALCLRREHKTLAARETASEAVSAFLSCGHIANGLAYAYIEAGQPQKAFDLLERIGATAQFARLLGATNDNPIAAEAKLSQREAQIAHLAVGGMSSRDTGLRLGISARTVETHLTNAYRKLGVASRAELAAELARLEARE